MRGATVMAVLTLFLGLPCVTLAGEVPSPAVDSLVVETFDRGEVYLYGNAEAPPYSIAVTDTALLLNGVSVYPKLPSGPHLSVHVSRAVQQQDSLDQACARFLHQLDRQGKSHDEIFTAQVEFYRASPLVAEVSRVRPGSFWVRWVGQKDPEEYLIVSGSPERISLRERIKAEARQYVSFLRQNCLIVVGSAENSYTPPEPGSRIDAIHEEIRLARTADPADLKAGQWHGRYITLTMARQFHDPLALKRTGVR